MRSTLNPQQPLSWGRLRPSFSQKEEGGGYTHTHNGKKGGEERKVDKSITATAKAAFILRQDRSALLAVEGNNLMGGRGRGRKWWVVFPSNCGFFGPLPLPNLPTSPPPHPPPQAAIIRLSGKKSGSRYT